MNLDSLTFQTRRRRDGKWETACPQLSDCRAVHADRAEAISRCVRGAFQRFYELDAERRFGDFL